MAGRFNTHKLHTAVLNKRIKNTHCITTASDTGDHSIRKFAFFLQNLLSCLITDNSLKISNYHGIRMRANNRANSSCTRND